MEYCREGNGSVGTYTVKLAVPSRVLLSVLSAPERCLEPLNVACSPHLSLVSPSPAFFSMSVFSGCSFTFLSITFLFILILRISLAKSVQESTSHWTLVLFSVISSSLIIILTCCPAVVLSLLFIKFPAHVFHFLGFFFPIYWIKSSNNVFLKGHMGTKLTCLKWPLFCPLL